MFEGIRHRRTSWLMGGTALVALLAQASSAQSSVGTTHLEIPAEPLDAALNDVGLATDSRVMFSKELVSGRMGPRLSGDYRPLDALKTLLAGTDLRVAQNADKVFLITAGADGVGNVRVAAATRSARPSGVETVVVTAEKKTEDIQTVPIAVSAFTQKDLKERQVATGGDLIREVPNMNFGKTNFSGYSIELRGIGTQAISVTTDPAVAVAFNGIPFLRNHFFEQEFFDLGDVEVLRGPQGTLYGRNATAGVVNLVSAKPTDQFEAIGSADFGNYNNRRLEGMINLPIVGDTLDLRVAGEWTKRDGYSFDTITNKSIDGRDLWSGRVSLRWKPTQDFETNLVWEHFSEDDDRLRSGKQLCKTAPIPSTVNGVSALLPPPGDTAAPGDYLSQGCLPTSLYSKDAFEVPNGFSLAYYAGLTEDDPYVRQGFDPYASTTQSTNLRHIESSLPANYRAKNDTITLTSDYKVTPTLTLTSQSGFSQDFLRSTEDYNRFNTAPGIFQTVTNPKLAARGLALPDPNAGKNGIPSDAAIYCDPQLGCQDRLVLEDLNDEHAWQLSQELRLASQFDGPLNFSAGGNYMHYETEENYYVFVNTLTQFIANNADQSLFNDNGTNAICSPVYRYPLNNFPYKVNGGCQYIDPNPISSLNSQGHNYFLSQNPYVLNSYALFGELYYNITPDLKLTAGLRWTDDRKHFTEIPSELLIAYSGYPSAGAVDQQWQRFTGRGVLSWTPKLDFTDQTLIYASAARGYKAGGANPPGAIFPTINQDTAITINPIHPLTFRPEYIDAYEAGTKNSLLDDTLTLNADVFYYNYQNYQISRIVDRSAINDNFDAHVLGAEFESVWEPLPGLSFNLAAGVEDTKLANRSKSVDLMDRAAGNPNWMVVKPFITNASNCILPTYVVAAMLQNNSNDLQDACAAAYIGGVDPVTGAAYVPNPTVSNSGPVPAGYPGFDPSSVDPHAPPGVNNGLGLPPNGGQGFDKKLSHNALPNAPPVTLSFGAQYTVPAWKDWTATLRGDFYFQADSWARVFNDRPYDQLHGYTNLNLALILNSADGWQVMGYVKNVFDTTAITGDFLNSDDSGLTTNVFLTDPRLFGVRVTKDLNAGDWAPADDAAGWFTDTDGKLPKIWVELGGGLDMLDTPAERYAPPFMSAVTIPALQKALDVQSPPRFAFDEEAKVSFEANDSDWIFSGAVRFGRAGADRHAHHQTKNAIVPKYVAGYPTLQGSIYPDHHLRVADGQAMLREGHAFLDFTAGKDLGLGILGDRKGSSVVSGGLRFAQFTSKSAVDLRAEPDVRYPSTPITSFAGFVNFFFATPTFHDYHGAAEATRSFNGVGPIGSWDASQPVAGDKDSGEIDVDWSVNGALLFGRQKARGHHQTTVKTYHETHFQPAGRFFNKGGAPDEVGYFVNSYISGIGVGPKSVHQTSRQFNRERTVLVPNLGASVGLSMKYRNAAVSFGYRADYFFGAMDGGWDTRKSENRGFFGPYALISIGLGG